MRLSSNEVESRNHCTQLTVKPPLLTLSSSSVHAQKNDQVDSLELDLNMIDIIPLVRCVLLLIQLDGLWKTDTCHI